MSSTPSGLVGGWSPIPAQVTYVLDDTQRLQYCMMQVTATVNKTHFPNSPTNVDLSAVVNVPAAAQKSAKITSFSISGNVVTFVGTNNFKNGDIVTISGLGVGTYLNGQNLTLSGPTSSQFSAAFTHADVGSTNDSGTATQIQTTLYLTNVSQGTSPGCWFVSGETFTGRREE